jgi:hypothetical protein
MAMLSRLRPVDPQRVRKGYRSEQLNLESCDSRKFRCGEPENVPCIRRQMITTIRIYLKSRPVRSNLIYLGGPLIDTVLFTRHTKSIVKVH